MIQFKKPIQYHINPKIYDGTKEVIQIIQNNIRCHIQNGTELQYRSNIQWFKITNNNDCHIRPFIFHHIKKTIRQKFNLSAQEVFTICQLSIKSYTQKTINRFYIID